MAKIQVKGFKHHREPYGTHTIDGEYDDFTGYLKGVVVEGGTTSRLFHHRSTRSDVGQKVEISVSEYELQQGHKTSVAM